MQKSQVVTHFFIPADQHTPEAIHPAMRALHHPPMCFETRFLLQRLGFLAPRSDMRCEPELFQQGSPLVVVIAFIPTQALGGVWGGIWPVHGNALDGLAGQLAIIPMRAVYGQPARHAMAGGEDAAFCTALAAVRGGLAHLFPPQGGLGSSPRPSPAMPHPFPARPHIPLSPIPIRPQRRPPPPTPGNGDGRHSWNRYASCSGHATGPRCGARKRWHPALYDHRRGVDGTLKGAVFRGGSNGAMRSHNASGIRQSRWVFSWSCGLSAAPYEEKSSPQDTRQQPNGIAS